MFVFVTEGDKSATNDLDRFQFALTCWRQPRFESTSRPGPKACSGVVRRGVIRACVPRNSFPYHHSLVLARSVHLEFRQRTSQQKELGSKKPSLKKFKMLPSQARPPSDFPMLRMNSFSSPYSGLFSR